MGSLDSNSAFLQKHQKKINQYNESINNLSDEIIAFDSTLNRAGFIGLVCSDDKRVSDSDNLDFIFSNKHVIEFSDENFPFSDTKADVHIVSTLEWKQGIDEKYTVHLVKRKCNVVYFLSKSGDNSYHYTIKKYISDTSKSFRSCKVSEKVSYYNLLESLAQSVSDKMDETSGIINSMIDPNQDHILY